MDGVNASTQLSLMFPLSVNKRIAIDVFVHIFEFARQYESNKSEINIGLRLLLPWG